PPTCTRAARALCSRPPGCPPNHHPPAPADLPSCPRCGLGQLLFVRKLLPKQPQGPCRRFRTQSVICACWARHALALSSSRFLDHFRPRGTLARHARPCRAPRFCRTSTVPIQFSSPPALPLIPAHLNFPYRFCPPTSPAPAQPSFCAGFAAQKLLIR